MSEEVREPWPVLGVAERRVLGVLVEKQKTTDTYPLTLNGVVAGSNQKSNRDPILTLTEETAEQALGEAQKKGLAMQVIGGRVDKWRHLLYESWKVSSVELAVLTELLLRGPQTEGELRGRASRMDEIADLDMMRQIVKSLAERQLIVYLTPEGKRGTVVTHGFHDPQELENLRRQGPAHYTPVGGADGLAPTVAAPADDRWQQSRDEISELRRGLSALEQEVAGIKSGMEELRQQFAGRPAESH
jgi:uncharacterized protein YceH (UPF0502 family)